MINRLDSQPNPTDIGSTIIDILDYRATHQRDCLAYEFYLGKNKPKDRLTYEELARRAKAIALELITRNLQQERVLLIYPACLEFIAAFLGCLYAGAIAVPLYPPKRNKRRSRIESIITDCDAKGILTISQLSNRIRTNLVNTETSLEYIFTDSLDVVSDRFEIIKTKADTLAFLQYTSGSTGNPKGVRITHKNIIANSEFIYQAFEHSVNSKVVSWLPFYHDMGLIGGILQPLFGGFPVSLFSPIDFLRQPLLWLET
ncbi:MAG: AMP-binding protein, partial [Pleurocapsa sp.]